MSDKQQKSKLDCPCCGKNASPKNKANKLGAILCSVCTYYFHPSCVDVDKEVGAEALRWVETGFSSPWQCRTCKDALSKMNDAINANSRRILDLEQKQEAHAKDIDHNRKDIKRFDDNLKRVIDRLDKLETDSAPAATSAVLEELNERTKREKNLLLHNCSEADNPEDIEKQDRDGVKALFKALQIPFSCQESIRSIRRLGKKNDKARPIQLIFLQKVQRDMVLDKAPNLRKCENEFMKKVRITMDMTPQQRQAEQDLEKRVMHSNKNRSEDEINEGKAWKIIGQRGLKQARLLPLRENEYINDYGRAVFASRNKGGPATNNDMGAASGSNQQDNVETSNSNARTGQASSMATFLGEGRAHQEIMDPNETVETPNLSKVGPPSNQSTTQKKRAQGDRDSSFESPENTGKRGMLKQFWGATTTKWLSP